jgi:hypothetical protein
VSLVVAVFGVSVAVHLKGARQHGCRVPADTLAFEARAWVVWIDAIAQRSLIHGLNAAKAPGSVDKAAGEFVSAATGYRHSARREAANGTIEAKTRLGRLGNNGCGERKGTKKGQRQRNFPMHDNLHLGSDSRVSRRSCGGAERSGGHGGKSELVHGNLLYVVG